MAKKLITFVVPAFNEAGNIKSLVHAIGANLPPTCTAEYILVDDGSTDDTLEEIKKLSKVKKNIKYIAFTRNFGHQPALKAGLDHARGEAVITLDADGQHPPELIPQLIKLWEEGYKIVHTKRVNNEKAGGWLKLQTSAWFYRLINSLSETKLEVGAADFRLLDREVVEFIRRDPEATFFLRGLVAWTGYRDIGIDYQPGKRIWGKTKYSYGKMLQLAIDAITSFSILPLRFATIIGLVISLFSGLYALYAVMVFILNRPSVIIGWPSVIISVLFIGGLQLMMLGIIGEYIGKIFLETKKRPLYVVKEKSL